MESQKLLVKTNISNRMLESAVARKAEFQAACPQNRGQFYIPHDTSWYLITGVFVGWPAMRT